MGKAGGGVVDEEERRTTEENEGNEGLEETERKSECCEPLKGYAKGRNLSGVCWLIANGTTGRWNGAP